MGAWRNLATEVLRLHRGCDFVVERLLEQNVTTLFGLPADSINALFDAARKSQQLGVITCRHESNAALMASSFGKLTGRPAAVVATNGPGVTHLPIGTRDALLDGAPLIAISGAPPHALSGVESFQAVDGQALMSSTTYASKGIWAPEALDGIQGLLTVAQMNSEPVALAIGQDVLAGPAKRGRARIIEHPGTWRSGVATITRARTLCAFAERTVALVGDTRDAPAGLLGALLEGGIDVPVLSAPSSIHGPGWSRLPSAGQLLASNREAWTALQEADLILAVGRWPGEILSKPHSAVIHLCTSPKSSSQVHSTETVLGDSWEAVLQQYDRRPRSTKSNNHSVKKSDEVGRKLDYFIPDDAVVVMEPGEMIELVWSSVSERDRRFTSSFHARSRGYAIPASVGAKAALPTKQVVAVVDAFGWNLGHPEILTSIKHRLGVSVVAVGSGPALTTIRAQAQALGMSMSSTLGEKMMPNTIYSIEAPELVEESHPSTVVMHHLPGSSGAPERTFDSPETGALFASGLSKSGQLSPVITISDEEALLRAFNGLLDAAFDRTSLVVVTKVDADEAAAHRDWTLGPPGIHFKAIPHIPLFDRTLTPENLERARIIAETTRSLVHLQIVPSNYLSTGERQSTRVPHAGVAQCKRSVICSVADSLQKATKVAIVSGRGAVSSSTAIGALATRLEATVVASMGGGVRLDRSPHFGGYVGSSGHRAAHQALRDADVTLIFGMSNRGKAFEIPGQGLIIEVNIDAFTLSTSPSNRRKLVGTVSEFVDALNTELGSRQQSRVGPRQKKSNWRPQRHRSSPQTQQHRWWKRQALRASTENGELQPSQIILTVDKKCESHLNVRFFGDVGLNTLWLYRFKRSHASTIWTQSFATMGFSVPAGAAAALDSGAATIAIVGDGGMAMALPGIAGIARWNPPLLVIVLDNKGLGAIRYEQELLGWPEYESALENGDLARLAGTVGWNGRQVRTTKSLEDELESFLSAPNPTVLQVFCSSHEAPVPAAIPSLPKTASMIYSWVRQGRRGVRSALSTIRQVLRK